MAAGDAPSPRLRGFDWQRAGERGFVAARELRFPRQSHQETRGDSAMKMLPPFGLKPDGIGPGDRICRAKGSETGWRDWW
jgi:hypothetical protein